MKMNLFEKDTIRVVRQMDKFLANQDEAQQYFDEKKMAAEEAQTFMDETRSQSAPNQVPLLEMQERGSMSIYTNTFFFLFFSFCFCECIKKPEATFLFFF